jgi:manganese transport protein
MAGQMIMQGFVNFRIPIWLRRAVTMIPAFIVVALNANPTETLVLSQVVLSIALPVPMIALLHFTSSRAVIGGFANSRLIIAAATAAAAVVLGLNFVLLAGVFGLAIPGF